MVFSKPTIKEEDTNALVITDMNDVYSETNAITNKFLTTPIPTTTTGGHRVSNLFGKVRMISIQGRHYGDGYSEGSVLANIKEFVNEFEAWINVAGLQDRKRYTSIFGIEYNVVCDSFVYRWRDTTPVHIEYEVKFIEGGNYTNDALKDLLGI